jgi:hypothetical protein
MVVPAWSHAWVCCCTRKLVVIRNAQLITGLLGIPPHAPQVTMYHKNVARQSQQFAVWLAKRRQENIARRAAGGFSGSGILLMAISQCMPLQWGC